MDLQPGMRVRCVDAFNTDFLDVGAEYTVVKNSPDWWVDIAGGRLPIVGIGYAKTRFKPVVRVKAPTKRITNLEYAVQRAVAWYRSLSPADKAAHDEAQRHSWARGEAGLADSRHIFANAH